MLIVQLFSIHHIKVGIRLVPLLNITIRQQRSSNNHEYTQLTLNLDLNTSSNQI